MTQSLAASSRTAPLLLEFGRQIAEIGFFTRYLTIGFPNRTLQQHIRKLIANALQIEEQLIAATLPSDLRARLVQARDRWKSFPTEHDADQAGFVYDAAQSMDSQGEQSLEDEVAGRLAEILPEWDRQIWDAFVSTFSADSPAQTVVAFGRALWEGRFPPDLRRRLFRVIHEPETEEAGMNWDWNKPTPAWIPPRLELVDANDLLGYPGSGWHDQLDLQFRLLGNSVPERNWVPIRGLLGQPDSRPLPEDNLQQCHQAVLESLTHDRHPSKTSSDPSENASLIDNAESGKTTPPNEFLFSLHPQGNVDEVDISGFGEHARLSTIIGLRRLHRIVFAGSTGVRMAELLEKVSSSHAEFKASDGAINDPLAGPQEIQNIMTQLAELEREKSDAEETQNLDRVAEFQAKMQELSKYLLPLKSPQGKPRQDNQVVKWRATIYDSLQTVYKQLKDRGCQLLADHFEQSISSTGSTEATAIFQYQPSRLIPWEDRLPR